MAHQQIEQQINHLSDECLNNPFPGTNVPPDIKKTPEFGEKIGKAIYSRHQYYTYSTQDIARIYLNRQYAANNQDPNQYKSIIDPEWNSEQDKKTLYTGSLVNIKWDIWSVMKKTVNAVVGMFIDSRNTIQYNSIDKSSKAEKERKKNELLAAIYAKEELQKISEAIGRNIQNLSGEEQQLESPEDVEVYTQTSYKGIKEMGMEMLVNHNLKLNKFYENIEPRLVHDLVKTNKMVAFATFDRNNRIKIRYTDVAGYVRPESDHPTNEEHEYDGEVGLWTISELRDFLYETEDYKPGAEVEELLYKVAKEAVGKYGNPHKQLNSFHYKPAYNDYPYNDFRVEALWFNYYTIDWDVIRFKEQDGKTYVDWKKSIPEKPRHEYKRSDIEVAYEGLYIPAMGKVYGWKKQENMCRPYTAKGASPRLTRRFIYVEPNKRMNTSSSLVDDCRPIIDDIQVDVLKIRQLIANARPPGFMVDWHGLNEVFTAAGMMIEPTEIINMIQTKGIGFYVSRTEDGQFVQAPVHEIKSDIYNNLRTFIEDIQFKLEQIRQATGVNDSMDGSVQSSKALVGIQKMKAISGHRLLREIFNAYSKQFMKNLGDTMRDMIQTQIRYGWCEEEYRSVVGDKIYDVLKMEPDKPFPLFGTHVESVPDESELAMIERQVELGLQAGTIMPADVIDITSMSNVKQIMAVLKYRERKMARQRQESMQMAVQAEADKNASSANARAEAEERIIAAKAKAKSAELAQAHNNKIAEIVETKTLDGNNKLNEIHATADRDDEQIRLAIELQAMFEKGATSTSGDAGSKSSGGLSRAPKVRPTGVKKQVNQQSMAEARPAE